MKYCYLYLLFLPLLFCCCENSSIIAEGTLKIKNMDSTENAADITNIKIIHQNTEETILEKDIQIAPGIVKVFNLDADQYIVYASIGNNERKHCQCIISSGKTTYLQWEKKEEMNDSYILYEVSNF
jgi:hypothetical protein